jgi:hypothetical protein
MVKNMPTPAKTASVGNAARNGMLAAFGRRQAAAAASARPARAAPNAKVAPWVSSEALIRNPKDVCASNK